MGAEFKKVKPRDGVIVRFPRNYSILPKEGSTVPWTGPDGRYWRRRAMVGDVEIILDTNTNVVSDVEPIAISAKSRERRENK